MSSSANTETNPFETGTYTPDEYDALHSFASKVLAVGESSNLCDVSIKTADGKLIPACKNHLVHRSQYFENHFANSVKQPSETTIKVPISEKTMREVLMFIHLNDATVFHKSLKHIAELKDSDGAADNNNALKGVVADVVELARAADAVAVKDLVDLTGKFFQYMLKELPWSYAIVLERASEDEESSPLELAAVRATVAQKPSLYFGVPTNRLRYGPKKGKHRKGKNSHAARDTEAQEDARFTWSVLSLSARALRAIFDEELAKEPAERQALLVGLNAWARHARCNEPEEQRWALARELAQKVGTDKLGMDFFLGPADASGLLSEDALSNGRKHHLLAMVDELRAAEETERKLREEMEAAAAEHLAIMEGVQPMFDQVDGMKDRITKMEEMATELGVIFSRKDKKGNRSLKEDYKPSKKGPVEHIDAETVMEFVVWLERQMAEMKSLFTSWEKKKGEPEGKKSADE